MCVTRKLLQRKEINKAKKEKLALNCNVEQVWRTNMTHKMG
uniref:Uncharacterized protein n=1 Tax=Arundo donax TaxID=35708 RepID=A0A0A9AAW4_ARUDO